jgi:hypothetical protein
MIEVEPKAVIAIAGSQVRGSNPGIVSAFGTGSLWRFPPAAKASGRGARRSTNKDRHSLDKPVAATLLFFRT